MKIFKHLYFICILFGSFQNVTGQEVFKIQQDFTDINFDKHIQVFSTKNDILPNSLLDKKIKWKKNRVYHGFSNQFYWLKFSLQNTTNTLQSLYFEVSNPHIDYLDFYQLETNRIALRYRTGKFLPFNKRPIDNANFVFPIKLLPNETTTYYVKIDKRSTSVNYPTTLWNQRDFNKTNNQKILINGALFGMLFLLCLYSLLVSIYLKRILYLWYGLYILFMGLYLFTSMGYSFQYINQDSILFKSIFRITTLISLIVCHLKFVKSFLKIKHHSLRLYTIMNLIAGLLVALLLGYFIFPFYYNQHSGAFIKILYFLILCSAICCLLSNKLTYKYQKKTVILYLLSFGVIILGGVFLMAFEFGWLLNFKTKISPVFIGSLIEIIILSFALVKQMQSIDEQKNYLTIRVAEKQQEVVQAYVDGVEKEKLRVSEELHDNIGSQLANLSRIIYSETKLPNSIYQKSISIIDEVRALSHRLSPVKGNLLTFKEQLENLINETFSTDHIDYDYNFIGNAKNLNKKQQLNVYRILQEFLNNILKHAKATTVEIQFINLENELTLTIEDNGIGFNTNNTHKGLGLENIQRRVDYLKGTMEISSTPEQGTFIVVSVPTNFTIKKETMSK